MDIRKLFRQDSLVTHYGYYMMDNTYKSSDGRIYRIINKPDELNIETLYDMDIDYGMLIWSDFADSRSNDRIVLKDRNI